MAIAAGGWLAVRTKKSASEPAPAWNAALEKLFLTGQLRRNPTHAPILLRLAQIERSEGDLRAARRHLEQAVAGNHRLVDVNLELSLVCWEMGDFQAAEEHNLAVLRIDPGQPDALYNLGAISANRGDTRQARAFWAAAQRGGRSDAADRARQAIRRLEAGR